MQTAPPKTIDDCIAWISGLVDSAAQTVFVLKHIGLRWTADKKEFADRARAWDRERDVLQSELEKVKRQYLGLRRDHKRIRYNFTRTVQGLVYPRRDCSNCKNCKCVKPISEGESTWQTLALDSSRSSRATVGASFSQAGGRTLPDEKSDDRGEDFPGEQTIASQQRRKSEERHGSSGTGERKESPVRAEISPIPATPPRPGSYFRASSESIAGGSSGGNSRGHGHSSQSPVRDVKARNRSAQAPSDNLRRTSSFSASGRKRSRLELASSETKDALARSGKGPRGRTRTVVVEMRETRRHFTKELFPKHLASTTGVNFALNEAGRRQETAKNVTDDARGKFDLCDGKITDESKSSVGAPEAARVSGTPRYLEQDSAADGNDAESGNEEPTMSKDDAPSGSATGVSERDEQRSDETGGNLSPPACESAHYPELAMTVVSPNRKPRRRSLEEGARSVPRASAGKIEPNRLAPTAAKDGGDVRGEGETEHVSGGSNPSDVSEKIVVGGELDGVDEKQSSSRYKFQEVVRDRAKRAAMRGHDCEHCQAYVEAVAASPGERQKLLNMCSRHKHDEKNGRPAETPDGFWELSFADSI